MLTDNDIMFLVMIILLIVIIDIIAVRDIGIITGRMQRLGFWVFAQWLFDKHSKFL